MQKRIIGFSLVLLMLVATACTPQAPTNTTGATEAAATTSAAATTASATAAQSTTAAAAAEVQGDPANRPVIETAFWEITDTFSFQPGNDDALADYVMDLINVTFVGRAISQAQYNDSITLWAATDDLPNIWLYDGTGTNNIWPWQEQGLIRSIPNDLSEYPLLAKYLDEDALPMYERCKLDGTYWAIPRADFVIPLTYTQGVPFMRISDYEAMGSPPLPDSVDDWFDFCMLAKETFPEKAILSNGTQPFNLFGNINPELNNNRWFYYEEKELWAPPIFNNYERWKEVNRFWHAGLIDKDTFSVTDEIVYRDKFVTGESVIYVFSPFPGHLNNLLQPPWVQKNGTNIGDELMILPRPTDYNGNRYIPPLKYWSESYISGKTDDEQMAAIFRLFDYLLSEEGFELRRFGLEGKDYTKNGDEINVIREKDSSGAFRSISEIYPSGYFVQLWATWDEEFPFVDPSIDPKIRAFGQQYLHDKDTTFVPQPDTYNILLTTISTERQRELVINSGNEDMFKLAMSTNYDEDWAAFVKKYEDLGLWEMAAEINDIAKQLGYIE
ncbi:MAG: hypothetical protein FWH01_09305 [Oscillospiraceae bacterium]|nr:hypothetical protein [Oscillospiraceae bacterium]